MNFQQSWADCAAKTQKGLSNNQCIFPAAAEQDLLCRYSFGLQLVMK